MWPHRSWEYYAKCNKLDGKGQELYNFTYIWNRKQKATDEQIKQKKFIDIDNKMEIARHEAVRAILKVSINEIKLFLLKKRKKKKQVHQCTPRKFQEKEWKERPCPIIKWKVLHRHGH